MIGLSVIAFRVLAQDAPPATQPADDRVAQLQRQNDALIEVIRSLRPDAFEEVGLYRVEPGDTGARIALAHGLTLADMKALNPDVDWRRLRVWQVIRIRAGGEAIAQGGPQGASAPGRP